MRFAEISESFLQEIDYKKHKKLVLDYMQNQGYRRIGGGADAQVFAKDAGQVIKIIIPQSGNLPKADNTFLEFYKYVQQRPDDIHLPKFYRIADKEHEFFELDGETFRQTAMERLKPIPAGSKLDDVIFDMFRDLSYKEPYSPKYDNYKSLYNSMKDVMDAGTKLGFRHDIMTFGHSNVMLRGNIPVIMDPWVA